MPLQLKRVAELQESNFIDVKWTGAMLGRASSVFAPLPKALSSWSSSTSFSSLSKCHLLSGTFPSSPVQNCNPQLSFSIVILYLHCSPYLYMLFIYIICLSPHRLHESRDLCLVFVALVSRTVSIPSTS